MAAPAGDAQSVSDTLQCCRLAADAVVQLWDLGASACSYGARKHVPLLRPLLRTSAAPISPTPFPQRHPTSPFPRLLRPSRNPAMRAAVFVWFVLAFGLGARANRPIPKKTATNSQVSSETNRRLLQVLPPPSPLQSPPPLAAGCKLKGLSPARPCAPKHSCL